MSPSLAWHSSNARCEQNRSSAGLAAATCTSARPREMYATHESWSPRSADRPDNSIIATRSRYTMILGEFRDLLPMSRHSASAMRSP